MAIVKLHHIINAYIARDTANDVRYKYVLNVVPIIIVTLKEASIRL